MSKQKEFDFPLASRFAAIDQAELHASEVSVGRQQKPRHVSPKLKRKVLTEICKCGPRAWCSMETLAHRCDCSLSSIARTLKVLVEVDGLLAVQQIPLRRLYPERKSSRARINVYSIVWSELELLRRKRGGDPLQHVTSGEQVVTKSESTDCHCDENSSHSDENFGHSDQETKEELTRTKPSPPTSSMAATFAGEEEEEIFSNQVAGVAVLEQVEANRQPISETPPVEVPVVLEEFGANRQHLTWETLGPILKAMDVWHPDECIAKLQSRGTSLVEVQVVLEEFEANRQHKKLTGGALTIRLREGRWVVPLDDPADVKAKAESQPATSGAKAANLQDRGLSAAKKLQRDTVQKWQRSGKPVFVKGNGIPNDYHPDLWRELQRKLSEDHGEDGVKFLAALFGR